MARPRVRSLGSPTRYAVDTWAKERPDLDPDDYLFLIHVMRLGQLIDKLHDSFSRKAFGLSGADVRVLMILRRSQAIRAPKAAELAEAQMVTTGAMAKQLDRLEGLGLISKQALEGDGGGLAVHVTEAGLDLADQAMTNLVSGSTVSRLKRALPPVERKRLATLCEAILLDYEDWSAAERP
ncbi:MAG TPA: MarR family transcriptional regulator [Sphingobium sp.]|nr:MarR family transcriptional regulator [Sphingobium sp.]